MKKKSLRSNSKRSIETDDLFLFLCCAVRYALGRRSYIVSWVTRQLYAHAPALRHHDLDVLIQDIEQHASGNGYGDEYSTNEWMETLKYLKSLRLRNAP